jgi:hypothetical protein
LISARLGGVTTSVSCAGAIRTTVVTSESPCRETACAPTHSQSDQASLARTPSRCAEATPSPRAKPKQSLAPQPATTSLDSRKQTSAPCVEELPNKPMRKRLSVARGLEGHDL